MSQYRLAFAVSLFFEYGGMQRTLMRVARECVRRGHSVDIFTGGWIGEHPQDIGVKLLDTRAHTNTRSNDLLAAKLADAVRAGHYDCVAGFTKIPGLDVYYAGDPCYAARAEETRSVFYRLTRRYRDFVRQEAAVFDPAATTEYLLIAHQERDKFIRHYGTPAARFHLLPPGINRDRFASYAPSREDRDALRRELGVAADEQFVLLVGSRFKTKGVDRAIRALAHLPAELRDKTKLVVVGGDRTARYRWLARGYGVSRQVVFTGARDDLARFYHAAELLLHPPYSENTGTILIEAMLCGLPVLTTANCGFAFHVENAGAGRVCPYPFDQKNLDAMLGNMLLADKTAWKQNGIAYCEQVDLYSLIERAADIIVARAARNHSRQATSAGGAA